MSGINEIEILDFLKRFANGIATMFGSDCEVIVHDLKKNGVVIAVYNGHVTGRKEGDLLNLLDIYKVEDALEGKDFYNCFARTPDGRLIKSTTIHFKGEGYHYAFGINYDFTKLSFAETVLSNFIKTGMDLENVVKNNPSEQIIEELFEKGLQSVGKPVALMNKKDRMNLVRYLKDNGGFSFKKGIQIVADKMNVSRYTIYNYLKIFEEETNK